jgi:hypothetical protein
MPTCSPWSRNEIGDVSPVVSPTRVAWLRCSGGLDCNVDLPDWVVVFDGAQTLAIPTLYAADLAISDPWVTWSRLSFSGDGLYLPDDLAVFDTRKPIALSATQQILPCPRSNPCSVPGSAPVFGAGDRLLLSTEGGVPGPFELRLVDPRRPIEPEPLAACPNGNPCIARESSLLGSYAYSGDVIAWIECQNQAFCSEDATAEVYYAVPEASAGAFTALLALGATARARRPRRI